MIWYYKLRMLFYKNKVAEVYDSAILCKNVDGLWKIYCIDKLRLAQYGVYESKLEAIFALKVLLN